MQCRVRPSDQCLVLEEDSLRATTGEVSRAVRVCQVWERGCKKLDGRVGRYHSRNPNSDPADQCDWGAAAPYTTRVVRLL